MVRKLIDTLGEQPASTLMKCVLPDGANQVATKDDLQALEQRLRDYVGAALATSIAEALGKQTRTLMLTMAGFMLTIWVSLAVGAFA